jgi:hypothetical protein
MTLAMITRHDEPGSTHGFLIDDQEKVPMLTLVMNATSTLSLQRGR